ncbi:bifunctional adenosylcobinamide kinase/adenosylcobinamide-phosphate guanylyltransferase [Mycobacterium sp. MYCO198283]|uniref:bifunctional adenosylcobinamide kinase/adenosylcobinamide-phosphate guanylyltransferase n=1 Tax=Mycobacterium sp. MYCO198283 TaxID=2883505 RepID=UPI001E53202C|nr:bifunctional adenosylcobinamide kinase/adenosylcobinamide-phosphate guanylyltransferase [Mycobacterium sp. MYCO198283]MCG5432685.1 bifunctional adenosylcobinamide kinase/adenosylcobinamide-phosphate guanylyltransferase [Mycobacterium sp. MYCO198283]
MRTLVLGGIRSGKSRWAETAAASAVGVDSPVRYLATGWCPDPGTDASWEERVHAHRLRRPAHWCTVETTGVPQQLRDAPGVATLVDDVGGWLTAAFDRRVAWDDDARTAAVRADADDFVAAVTAFASPLVLVSPEVGLSVVPAFRAGRRFADELGALNQRLAAICDRVVLVVAGIPVPIKDAS